MFPIINFYLRLHILDCSNSNILSIASFTSHVRTPVSDFYLGGTEFLFKAYVQHLGTFSTNNITSKFLRK